MFRIDISECSTKLVQDQLSDFATGSTADVGKPGCWGLSDPPDTGIPS